MPHCHKNLPPLWHWGAGHQWGWGFHCPCRYASAGSFWVGLSQSEPWSSLLLFLVICGDNPSLCGLQKALAARFLTCCWPFEVWWTGCWKEEFLKRLLWNSEFIVANLCVVFLFITKNQIRMAVTFVWYAGGKRLKHLVPECLYPHLSLCLKSMPYS